MVKVTISKGNRKMGEIKSVSLPPIVTCAKNCTCAKKCYAAKMCRIYKNVKESYNRNLDAFNNNPAEYWKQVEDAICTSRFFRFHVSGDIPTYDYFIQMVDVVKNNPHCDVLVFTKRFAFVNNAIDNGVEIPKNLHILFSEWNGMEMENPHNLPVAHVIFKGDKPENNWNICTGNCLECAKCNKNCWALKSGEHVAFHEH
jgi:DNA repair photolyase